MDIDRLISKARVLRPAAGVRAFARIRRLLSRHLENDPDNAHLMRDAKVAELILACRLMPGQHEQLAEASSDLLSCYRSMPREERPIPVEPSACLRRAQAEARAFPEVFYSMMHALYQLTELAEYERLAIGQT